MRRLRFVSPPSVRALTRYHARNDVWDQVENPVWTAIIDEMRSHIREKVWKDATTNLRD